MRTLRELEGRRASPDGRALRDSPGIESKQIADLLALSAALATAATPADVAAGVVAHAPAVFGAAGLVVARVRDAERDVEIMHVGDLSPELREAWHRIPLDADAPLTEVARSGAAIFLRSRAEWAARYPALIPLLDETGHQANAVLPLTVNGRVLGVLGAAYSTAQDFPAGQRAVLETVASQCAQALERGRLFEAERSARQEAELANRAKSDFLAVMSHELRTPLNAIGGYAELIELGIHGPVTPEQANALSRIQNSQRHLLGLINGVLNYSRVEAGAVNYRVEAVPVDEVLATCEALIAPQVRARKLSLRFDGCDSAIHARGDREKVQQIVLNLLSNAVKFTEPGGSIVLDCVLEEPSVAIRVSDTGHGIEGNQLERVFQPFVQVDAKLTRTQEGTGLGLSISRDLARGMGGDLVVESIPEVGSTFTLSLPAD